MGQSPIDGADERPELIVNVPAGCVGEHPAGPLIVRASCLDDLPAVRSLQHGRTIWVEAPNALVSAELPPEIGLDVLVADPATEAPSLYQLTRLRDDRPLRVTLPVAAGVSRAARIAIALQLPLRLLPLQPRQEALAELHSVLDLYLPDPQANTSVQPFDSALAYWLHGNPTTAWMALDLDPAFVHRVPNRGEKTLEFLTGYLIEKSLAVDNVFLWLMLFSAFGVPLDLQRRVLVYGVVGAIVMRTAMIFAGAAPIARFHWILYVFGAFLLYTGVKMFWFAEEEVDLEKSAVVRYLRRHVNITTRFHGERFFTTENGVRCATPLFLALVMVEFTDLVFAVDSIPAIFAITTDPFIVYSVERFRDSGTARSLLCTRRRHPQVQVSASRPGHRPGFRRPQDANRELLQDSHPGFSRAHHRRP